MHVIIGGAHNGKKAYVEKLLADVAYHWVDCTADSKADSPALIAIADLPLNDLIVIEHIDHWLEKTDMSETAAIDFILKAVENRDIVFILTDIGRGIVPMDAGQRALRDACGRLYQQLIAQAEEVTRIWYGLAQNLKTRGE